MELINKKQVLLNQSGKTLYSPESIVGHNDEKHENQTETLTQDDWLLKNIPFIHTPDKALDEVYYFRWRNLMSAMSKRKESGKYEFCESAPGNESYHNYIDCAQGAHVREARWIKDEKYLNDYLDITPDKTVYREYLTDSVWQKYLLDGDVNCIQANYEKLKSRLASLDDTFDSGKGLYHSLNNIEGEEAGINGFDHLENMLIYSASFVANGDSLSALHDNDCCNKMWSGKGSQNAADYVEIEFPFESLTLTGVRIWFAKNKGQNLDIPRKINMFYQQNQNWMRITNVDYTLVDHPQNCTVLSFSPVQNVTALKIEFENNLPEGMFTGIYELVPTFCIEPWGCNDWWTIINGRESFRVGVNAYEAAAMYALSKMAELLGLTEESRDFSERAKKLRSNILSRLWSDKQNFFIERIMETNAQNPGKESCAYAPWCFSLVPNEKKFNDAFKFVTDEDAFLCKYGLTSLEKNSPHYMQEYNHPCIWNGPVWPYTFSQCLTAISNVIDDFSNIPITKSGYYDLLKRYISCHYDNGSHTILITRENHHPEENRWIAQAPNYNHSTFVDNVLNGLFGIRPQPESKLKIQTLTPDEWDYFCLEGVNYHKHSISLLFDKNGEQFGHGAGYFVFADGKQIFHSVLPQNIEIDFNRNSVAEI